MKWLLFLFLVTSCHVEHHGFDKHRFDKRAKNVQLPQQKDVENPQNYVSWKIDKTSQVLVKKAWHEGKEDTCIKCHAGHTLKQMKGKVHKRAHWQIKLSHAPVEQMSCQTCHSGDKVWNFREGRRSVSANQSVALCSQCHFEQKKDWEMGAHGKRATGWQEERAVYHCVSCHNPHNPSFKKKWPEVSPHRILSGSY